MQKDAANSESEYTPKSDTSSGVSSGGSSSAVTLGSNDSLFFGASNFEGSEKHLHSLSSQPSESEYSKVEMDIEMSNLEKHTGRVLRRRNISGNQEPTLNSAEFEGMASIKGNSWSKKNLKEVKDSVNSGVSALDMKQVFVRLNRLSEKDQELMQKSLSEFAQQQPLRANKLGITTENYRKAKPSTIESDSEEDDKKSVSRIFKSRDRNKAREEKKKQGMFLQNKTRFCFILNEGCRIPDRRRISYRAA